MISEEFIANCYPFNTLKRTQIQKLLHIAEVSEYKKDQIIYREDDNPDFFYLLVKGRVIAYSTDSSGERPIELIKKGTSFGIISILTGDPHSVTTRAIEACLILKIEKIKFRSFLSRTPSLAFAFSEILSKRVKKRVDTPKTIFQSQRISVCARDESRGLFTFCDTLGVLLREETQKKVIIAEICERTQIGDLQENSSAIRMDAELQEEEIERHIKEDNGVGRLSLEAGASGNEKVHMITNYLSEHYHFILYMINLPLSSRLLSELFDVSNSIYVITREHGSEGLQEMVSSCLRVRKHHPEKKAVFLYHDAGSSGVFPYTGVISSGAGPLALPDNSNEYTCRLRRTARILGERSIGVVLSSGGAYGFAHIGVLKVLAEHEIPVDMVCGSSMGALVAALWAKGYSSYEMQGIVEEAARKLKLFSFPMLAFPFKGLLKSKRLEKVFKAIFGKSTFDELMFPLGVVVFDFRRREPAVVDTGQIYKAVAASCAMPGIFEPILTDKRILMDGGVLSPLPVSALLNYNIKKIIAVNVIPSKDESSKSSAKGGTGFNIFDYIFGSIETMQQEMIRTSLDIADVIVHPPMDGFNWTEFGDIGMIIKRGEQAALEKLDDIRTLAAS